METGNGIPWKKSIFSNYNWWIFYSIVKLCDRFLPLSIGMGSTNLTARGMIDYRHGRFTATGSAAYIWRNNVKIDRTSYFDTELRLTNEVKMPDASLYQLRTGYRQVFDCRSDANK